MKTLRSSGGFDAYWEYHVKQEYQRNHVAQHAEDKVIPVKGRSPPMPDSQNDYAVFFSGSKRSTPKSFRKLAQLIAGLMRKL